MWKLKMNLSWQLKKNWKFYKMSLEQAISIGNLIAIIYIIKENMNIDLLTARQYAYKLWIN